VLEYLPTEWPKLAEGITLGYFVGGLTSFFGAGGGFIITPALNIFLGLPMNLAVGTSSLQIVGASAFSLFEHLDKRLLGIRVALCLGLGIPFGAFCGAMLIRSLKNLAPWHLLNGEQLDPLNAILLSVLALFLLLIAAWMLYDTFLRKKEDESLNIGLLLSLQIQPTFKFRTIAAGNFSIPVMVGLGGASGFLSGLLGIGGGVIMLPMLYYLVGQDTKAATQTSIMLVFISGLFSTIFHSMEGNIDYALAFPMIFGAFFGVKTGAILHRKVSGKSIRTGFGFVVLGAWLLVILKLWRMLSP